MKYSELRSLSMYRNGGGGGEVKKQRSKEAAKQKTKVKKR
jgi:hypothetical protein